jgi:polysaccharide export outer membrane protein
VLTSRFRSLIFVSAATSILVAQATDKASDTYALGIDDQIMIKALDADEVTTLAPLRIDGRGDITLPMIGRVHAAGLTTDQLSGVVAQHLKKYLRHPDVSVYLVEMRSQPISVLGSVQNPGVHQLQGRKNLFEVISLAGGIRADAGYTIKITRRLEWGPIPLATAKGDPTGQFSVASVSVKSIMAAENPGENIEIKPDDVISVPKGELIYVIGAVRKPGGFVLGESEHLSTLQVLSLAEGLDNFADARHAKIMRPTPGSESRQEIPIDLKRLLKGNEKDLPLQANDLLFVPLSGKKAAVTQTVATALGMGSNIGTGLVLYRH